mgnify:FL=1
MFGLFKSTPFRDPQLGELVRSRGLWRGALKLASGESVPLALAGDRAQPDAQALALARDVSSQLAVWRPIIESALFEHYAPYAEAFTTGQIESPDEVVPKILAASEVWLHSTLIYVAVTPIDGKLATELGYTTSWDEEHTLGARFQAGEFVELCGSVLPP